MDTRLELLNEWRAELKEAVESLDVNTFRRFATRWIARGIYEQDIYNRMSDEVLEIAIRKMAVNMTETDPAIKEESKRWLLDRGYDLEMA